MSTKSTIFLTKDNEHCYFEMLEDDNGHHRIYLEIDAKNIKDLEQMKDGSLLIGLAGDSDLAEQFKKIWLK